MAQQFRLLGPMEVVGPAGPVTLGGITHRAVLAVLALNRNRTVAATTIMEAAWAGEPPPSGIRTLHSAISRLRSALAKAGIDATIEAAGSGYRLAAREGLIDIDVMQRLADEDVAAALAMWRGPALEEFADLPMLAAEANRLEEIRWGLIERRIDGDLAGGHLAGLVGELESLLGAQPLREKLWEQLLLALYRSGRQGDALRAYQRCRSVFADSGLEPSAELAHLESRIATRDGDLDRGRGAAQPAAADLPPTTVHVGEVQHRVATGRVAIGAAATNDIVVDDDAVSGVHALLQWVGAAWVLTDLGSSNGTWVNGARLTTDRALRPGDDIRVGFTRLQVVTAEPRRRQTVTLPRPPDLDEIHRSVLQALCRPLLDRDILEPPAGVDEIVASSGLSTDAVTAHLDRLAELFGVPGGDGWVRLARTAVAAGAVSAR